MELWTAQHAASLLPALACMIVLAAILRLTMGNKDEKIRRIPLQIIAVLLLLLEIGKQGTSLARGYDPYCIPLHFCSLFLITVPAAAFYTGKYAAKVRAVNAAFSAAMALLFLIYPALIYGAEAVEHFFDDFMHMHTVAFHNLVLLAFILQLALDLYTPAEKGDIKAVELFTLGYCVVAASMAQLLKVNFNNFYSCNVPPLEQLRLSLQPVLGYGWTQFLYVLIVIAVDLLFVLMSYWLYRGLRRLLQGRAKQVCR